MPTVNVIGITNTAFHNADGKFRQNIVSINLNNTPYTNGDMSKAFYGDSTNKPELTTLTNLNTNITNTYQTFRECYKLTTTPVIPNSVTNMCQTFWNCSNLTVSPNISSNATNVCYVFYGCSNLTSVSAAPSTITNMAYAYARTNITAAPSLPTSTISLGGTFQGCSRLTTPPTIPNSVTTMIVAFQSCSSLTDAPVIPNAVTNLQQTFSGCTKLVNIPNIPDSVTCMKGTFTTCTNLTSFPHISNIVTDLSGAFQYCYNITGNMYVNSTAVTNAMNCFGGTSLIKNVYIPYTYTNGDYTPTYTAFVNEAGYSATGTKDAVYIKNTVPVTLTITPTPSDATVTLTCDHYIQSGNSIIVSQGRTVTYTVAKGNMSVTNTVTMSTTDQTIPVELLATLTINPTPSNATVTLSATGYTPVGKSITVPVGTSVSYSVSYSGLQTQSNNNYIVNDTETKNITLTYASGTVLLEKSAAGTYTFTPIAPVNCTIICIGAGGGASESWQTGSGSAVGAVLAAGGSGGYSRNTNATISSQVTATVGNYSETGTGGTTSVGSLCSANGGQAGYASVSGGSYGGPGGSGNYSNGNTGEYESHTFVTTETLTKNGGAAKLSTYGKGCSITTEHTRRGTTTSGVYIHSHTTTIGAGTAGYVKITAN